MSTDPDLLQRARILVVEDDPASARLASIVLRGAGADVTVAATATAATRLILGGFRPALVLLDLDLPDLPGMHLAKVLRTLDDTRDIPIIAFTASGISFGEQAALAGGCDAYLRKPIDVDSFPGVIAGFLAPGWSRPAAAPPEVVHSSIEGRQAAILDIMAAAVAVLRPVDLTMVYANRKFQAMTGYAMPGLVGMPIAIANPDGVDGALALRDDVRRQLATRGEARVEVPRLRADRSMIWLEITFTPLVDDELGELWVTVFDDITTRRRSAEALEKALARSEHRFARLAEAGVLAVVTSEVNATGDGRVLDANDRFLELIGWSRDDLQRGRLRVSDFVVPDRGDRDAGTRAALRDGRDVRAYETEFRRRDSVRIPVLVGGALLDPTTTIGFAVDLSDLRRSEAALRDSQHRFDALWRSGVVGVVISDIEGPIVEANDAYLEMIGYSREDLEAGRIRYDRLTPPEHRAEVERALAQIVEHGSAAPWETETFRKDRTRVPIMVGVAAIDDRFNVAIVTDLSARKLAEDQLRRTEDQLRHAQKMEAVGRLAGGIAHDFNNLLSVILSYTNLLVEDLDPNDPMRGDLQEVGQAANRAAELTRQLSVFSRQQVIEAKVMNPNEVLLGMDRMLRRLIGEDVELVTLPSDDAGRVEVAPSHLEQVIVNLAVNARDAMPGGGTLTIETSNVDIDEAYERTHNAISAGRYVMLAVSDTGCGMDRETQARIFEPFFTTKPVGSGTGLGLSIVFGIVQQNRGHVWVYSELGHGTTFKIYLPRVDAQVRVRPATINATALRGSETILLVEDEDQVRKVAHGILRRAGYHVLEARNPGEALLLVENHPGTIDLLLTDVVMPQMSGPELARRLAQLRPGLRVLCMSGYTDDSVARHAVVDRGVPFLQKPLTPDSLTRKVREVLGEPGGGPSG